LKFFKVSDKVVVFKQNLIEKEKSQGIFVLFLN
jgi:hypothetical protein